MLPFISLAVFNTLFTWSTKPHKHPRSKLIFQVVHCYGKLKPCFCSMPRDLPLGSYLRLTTFTNRRSFIYKQPNSVKHLRQLLPSSPPNKAFVMFLPFHAWDFPQIINTLGSRKTTNPIHHPPSSHDSKGLPAKFIRARI